MRSVWSIALVLLLLLAGPAHGREAVIGMSERVFKGINKAQALMDEEAYQEALDVLEPMRDKRLTSYETAQVLRLIGLVTQLHGQRRQSLDARGGYPTQPVSLHHRCMVSECPGTIGRNPNLNIRR